VLVTFITGLALGSLVLGWLGDRVARPDLLLLWSQLGAAGTLLVASQLLGDSQFFFSKLLFTFRESFDQQQLMKATALFAFMIVPTVLLGGTFPLAGKLLARSPETVGRALGVGYAVNTLGCVAGSATAGFLLLPLVGGELGLSLVASLQILTAGAGIALSPGSPRVRWGTLAVSAAGLLCCVAMPRWDQVSLASSKYHRLQQLVPSLLSHGWWDALVGGRRVLASMSRGELLYHGQGVGGVTTVLRTRDVLGNPEISMANSGKFDASSVGDMKTQVLLAHVPMVMHAEPELVMVLGLASGVTAGEVLYYPSVRRMDILEIGSQVVDGSRFFDELNNRVLDHPKAHLIIQDARAHLALSGERYDVIVSEPSNPWMAGMADLFTREFFTLARSRLRPGGAFAQFIHSYEIDWDSFALVLRTFADVFPGAVMLATHPAQEGADYLLVGFADPTQRLSLDGTAERREALQRSRNVRLADPSLLYRLVVTEDLPALAGDGPLNTEDHPILEFSAPRALYVADASIRERIRQRRRVLPGTAERVQALVDDPEAAIAYAEFALSLRTPFAGMEPAHASDAQQRRFGDLISAYAEQFPIDCDLFRDAAVASECLRRQIGALERRTAQLDADGLAYLADLHARAGRVTEARAGFEAALAREPMTLLALNGLGMLAGQAGDHAAAIGYFREAQRLNPFLVEPYLNLGVAYLALGERQQAARQFTTALNLDPSSALAKRGLRQSLQP
jgi:spermidine synthase